MHACMLGRRRMRAHVLCANEHNELSVLRVYFGAWRLVLRGKNLVATRDEQGALTPTHPDHLRLPRDQPNATFLPLLRIHLEFVAVVIRLRALLSHRVRTFTLVVRLAGRTGRTHMPLRADSSAYSMHVKHACCLSAGAVKNMSQVARLAL